MELILYGTDFCQLCDEALALIEEALEGQLYEMDVVDISKSDELMARYAYSIPVLKRLGAVPMELNWPFTTEQIRQLVSG